jgi:hypothetical protein
MARERTPHEEQELLQRARGVVAEAEERAEKRRWLVTLRSLDGLERHMSVAGDPPPYIDLAIMGKPCFTVEPIEMSRRRSYRLERIDGHDGTAIYLECE